MGVPADAARKHLVMVVDDDDDIRETLAAVLEDEGYEVAPFPTGRPRLTRSRAGVVPRVILLDLMMPVMDGAEFRRAQLADQALAGIPVILITAAGARVGSRASFSPRCCASRCESKKCWALSPNTLSEVAFP